MLTWVWVYVCMCVCVCACVCVWVCLHMYVCLWVHVCMFVSVHGYFSVCKYVLWTVFMLCRTLAASPPPPPPPPHQFKQQQCVLWPLVQVPPNSAKVSVLWSISHCRNMQIVCRHPLILLTHLDRWILNHLWSSHQLDTKKEEAINWCQHHSSKP